LGTTGCQIGDEIFSSFTYTHGAGGTGSLLSTSSIEVTTLGLTTGSDPAETSNANTSLNFSTGWSVTADCPSTCTSSFEDAVVGFTVTVVDATNVAITDAAVMQTSSGATGAGSSVLVSEGGCSGAPCTPGTWGLLSVVTPGDYTENAADAIISATGSIVVSKDLSVTAGAVWGGAASLSYLNDTLSETVVPEPLTSAMLGTGLIGLGLLRRTANQPLHSFS
jgi:hypothetical protein